MANLELTIFLLLSPKCWEGRYVFESKLFYVCGHVDMDIYVRERGKNLGCDSSVIVHFFFFCMSLSLEFTK